MRKELLIARILAGVVRLKYNGRTITLKGPTPEQYYEAEEIYEEILESSIDEGVMDDNDLYNFLCEQHFWDENREELLEKIPNDIQDAQVKLFENLFRSDIQSGIRDVLVTMRAKFGELWAARHSFDHLTCEGAARIARSRFLLFCSLHGPSANTSLFLASDKSLDELSRLYSDAKIPESSLRSLARTEPWRSLWGCKKAEGGRFFDKPIFLYTEEQRSLVNWSLLFDNIYEHPECPSDDVIADDDMLDGWLIIQKRKRGDASGQSAADQLIKNEKIRNSEEVFLVAGSQKDADRIHKLNSPQANRTRRQKLDMVKKHGEVDEVKMPDAKAKIRQQGAAQLAAHYGAK